MAIDEEQRAIIAGSVDVSVWEEMTCLDAITGDLTEQRRDALRWIVRSAYSRGRADTAVEIIR